MRILFLADIVGKLGRKAVTAQAGELRRRLQLDWILANAENVSGGIGLTPRNAQQLHSAGVDVLTSGNHIWKHKEIQGFLESTEWLLRPANYPPGSPGRGSGVFDNGEHSLGVINVQGRTFMEALDCPFRRVEEELEALTERCRVVLVDLHAEATSEKKAMLFFLAGRASALIGTHTHVQTADAQVLDGYTGYITDAGMCGPERSVIGMEPESVLERFVSKLPQRFTPAGGEVLLQGVLLDVDPVSGRTMSIEAWQMPG
jgi:hypothetical protein